MIVWRRRAAGIVFQNDDLKRPGVVGNVGFGRPHQQRILDLAGSGEMLDFLLALHERRKPVELIELAADENSDQPAVVRCAEIFDVLEYFGRSSVQHT